MEDAIRGFSIDVVVTHVLGSENMPHTSGIARLRTVSRSMRNAVARTGCRVKEPSDGGRARLGDIACAEASV
jgi:hypothetical protein